MKTESDLKHQTPTPVIRLKHIELFKFRRLGSVRVALDDEITVLAGANNSGKTSILTAVRHFLEGRSFGVFDLSINEWQRLRELGASWEDDDRETDVDSQWERDLEKLNACMPALDLWFEARGSFHLVAPFIPSLSWSGGPVGIRLRLEPARTTQDLQVLAAAYRQARTAVSSMGEAKKAWPIDLLDYWQRRPPELGKVFLYKLDPEKSFHSNPALTTPQPLSVTATPVEPNRLAPLLRVDFIPAQRGLGAEEADGRRNGEAHKRGLFSNQLLQLARRELDKTEGELFDQTELVEAMVKAQADLDGKFENALAPAIQEVRSLGYPGLHDPQGMHIRTRIQPADLLNHGSAVQYSLGDGSSTLLPEQSIGLGYQNLQSLSFQLVAFKQIRLAPEEGPPPAVHLVLLEEPEAHLHVQVQTRFPQRALRLTTPIDSKYSHLATQLLITTHSSHLAHSVEFNRIRYIRRVAPSPAGVGPATEVVNLADVFGPDDLTRVFAERYFRVQHTDLLFADAAVFVEGTAERMLVPLFIDKDFKELRQRHISFLEVGGSHAHRLKPLVERLAIPTVVITDIDPVREVVSPITVAEDPQQRLWQEGKKKIRKAAFIDQPEELRCGNPTLMTWHPGFPILKEFAGDADNIWTSEHGGTVRFAWQTPIGPNGPWPSSFEDAFVLTNVGWFRRQTSENGAMGKAIRLSKAHNSLAELAKAFHTALHRSFDKGEFAATLFERLCSDDELQCPQYINAALSWLQEVLEPTKSGGHP